MLNMLTDHGEGLEEEVVGAEFWPGEVLIQTCFELTWADSAGRFAV
jgi:hypothetical protein